MSNHNYIVRTSKDDLYRFYIESGNLIVERFEGLKKTNEYTYKRDILEYSLYIDQNDKIYIVYITNKGQLMYTFFNSNSSDMEILHLTSEILVYSLNILFIDSIVHIFFVAKDTVKECNCLYHCYLYLNEWISEEVEKIDCLKYTCPYFLDSYEKDIYLLYCKNNSSGEYVIRKYNTTNKEWYGFQDSILIKNIINLNFFISLDGTGIIYFNKIVNSNAQTHILIKNFNIFDSTWNYNNISVYNLNTLKPIIFCKNNIFYYIWNTGTSIMYKKSDNLINWSKEFELYEKKVNMMKIKYLSNFDEDRNLKINLIYLAYFEALYQIINPKLSYCYESLSIDNLEESHNNMIATLEKNPIHFMLASNRVLEDKDFCINTLRSDLECKDKIIKHLNEMNTSLSIKIKKLNKLIDDYRLEIDKLKMESTLRHYENSDINYNYEVEMIKLKKEMDNIVNNTNGKIRNLLNIVEEKEQIIVKLQNIIKSKK